MNEAHWTDPYHLAPALPDPEDIDALRDLASEIVTGSRELEATLAPETAEAIGDKLRIINSYYSNSIEGLVTTYRDIESEVGRAESGAPPVQILIPQERYSREVGAAHVQVEKELMKIVLEQKGNVSHPEFIALIHKNIFSKLPPEHQFTHERGHFTDIPVLPGTLRDGPIHVGNKDYSAQIGPETKEDLEANMQAFGRIYNPSEFRGGEAQVVAAAAAHLKLGWLHPFRDGNGRTIRLQSTLFLARCGVNRANLWSLSRGLSMHRGRYFSFLAAGNPQPTEGDRKKLTFQSENVAMFCEGFLTIAKEQIHFMKDQLRLRTVSNRIDRFAAEKLARETYGPKKMEAARVLRAVFSEGSVERARMSEILPGMSERTIRSITSGLVKEGLIESKHTRAPFTIGLPAKAMSTYFPDLCIPSLMGTETAWELERNSPHGAR
jgi:Fic family protein